MNALHKILAAAGLIMTLPAQALTIEFDYTYDTKGFFTDILTGAPLLEQRTLLNQAAAFYSGFSDSLTAIAPKVEDTWSVEITNPSNLSGDMITLSNLNIANNTLRIYVGGSLSAPGVLGFANTGYNLTADGSAEFVGSVNNRGQVNATGPAATDYGVWGGMIWFNSRNNWYFGSDAAELSPGKPDFLTTATHEIGHILGFGTADSWQAQVENGYFKGSASVAAYGGDVPLDSFASHWATGTTSTYQGVLQNTLMDPSTPAGKRELPTVLDYAAFADIGWQVSAVPEPTHDLLVIIGSGIILLSSRRRLVK